jgi:hypothetical protein
MSTKNGSWVFALGMILTVFCASVCAQQTVYKWVDEEGVIHFGDEPPGESQTRDKKIAPLRKAEIANCIQTETGDQAWCETFWADYGDARRSASGMITPRLFHDLPECVEALDERHRR